MKREHITGLEKRLEDLQSQKRLLSEKLRTAKAELQTCRAMLQRRESLYHAAPSILVVIQDGRVVDVNDSVTEQLGYAPDELLGRDFLDIVGPGSRAQVREVHARRLARKAVPEQYEAAMVSRDGDLLPYEVRVRKILLRGKRAFVVGLTPMGKRREREENRLRSKKMEAVLTMASALAGRFGRHCTDLRTRIQRLQEAAPKTGQGPMAPELRALEHIMDDALRTTHQLKMIAREDMEPSESRAFDLRDVVKEAVSLGSSAVEGQGTAGPSSCQVKTYLRSGPRITGNPEELRDVIAHLVRNALEAMPEGGDLYVTSEESGGQAHLTIMDNGMGVPEQVMDRIFDPFFTTRGKEASGLGLSVAYAVIRRHGGEMEVTSEKGEGTEIRVRIPVASAESVPEKAPAVALRRREKVLVIAVTEMVRVLMERCFSAQGWRVMTASSAEEGLGRLQRGSYGGIVLEGLEGAGGRDAALAGLIKKRHGNVPVVLIAQNGRGEEAGDAAAFDLIARKPLFMNSFTSQVLQVFSDASHHRVMPANGA